MNRASSRRRLAGFTLIELLAVIAIIAVLAGIMITVVGNVRNKAKEAQSLSNLRQMGSATLLYAGEHRGDLPVWLNFTTGKHWWVYLQDYAGTDPQLFHSPAHEGFDPTTHDTMIVTISYGWNYAVSGRAIGDTTKVRDHKLSVNRFDNPSRTLIIADARDNSYGYISSDTPVITGRYGDNVPSVFLDGHVSSRPSSEFLQVTPWFDTVEALPPDKPVAQ